MNFGLTATLLARLYLVLAVAMLASIPWGWAAEDHGGADGLAISAGLAVILAVVLGILGRRSRQETMRIREALLIVTVGWISAALLGALPYVITGAIPHFHDAFFETVSGFTTTGATILTDIEALPRALQFWRIAAHWLGGLGIVVLFVALFPQLGVGAKHLFKSEVPGPITEGLRPKIKQTAMFLWWIYLGLTAAEALLLWLAGMSPFEATVHAMSTLATGGFSTRSASIAGFDSPTIEWIICLFMYLAGINFALHYAALTGRLRMSLRDGEWRVYTGMILVFTSIIALWILPIHDHDIATALRKSLFQVLAIATTTGFATDDFEVWPIFPQFILLALMFVGGSAGSTSGGMKVSRIVILVKTAVIEVGQTVRPHAVRAVKVGRTAIRPDILKQVYAFAVIFPATVLVSTLAVAIHGVDMVTAFSASLACVGTIGPGFGEVGPTDAYAFLPASAKIVLSFAMILGRLEFFTVLALLLPSAWRR